MAQDSVTRIYPAPVANLPLENLYFQHALQHNQNRTCPCVYTNFITSLDGRIAVDHPDQVGHKVPHSITNERDWRLYQELAAQADVLVVSARYLRELAKGHAQDALPLSHEPAYADLHQWRSDKGMDAQPAVVVISSSLDLPLDTLAEIRDRPVYVATGEQADTQAQQAIRNSGARILHAGSERHVDGGALVDALAAEGFSNIYSIAGPGVMQTLLDAGVLNRLYLTQAQRMIGGEAFDTLLEGELSRGPVDFKLVAQYLDPPGDNPFGQFFSIYETGKPG